MPEDEPANETALRGGGTGGDARCRVSSSSCCCCCSCSARPVSTLAARILCRALTAATRSVAGAMAVLESSSCAAVRPGERSRDGRLPMTTPQPLRTQHEHLQMHTSSSSPKPDTSTRIGVSAVTPSARSAGSGSSGASRRPRGCTRLTNGAARWISNVFLTCRRSAATLRRPPHSISSLSCRHLIHTTSEEEAGEPEPDNDNDDGGSPIEWTEVREGSGAASE